VTHVQRPGWIRRYELDLDPAALPGLAAAEIFGLFEDAVDDRLAGAAGDEKIDESRAGDFDTLDVRSAGDLIGDQLRQLTRRLGGRFCQHQRNVGSIVALARILRRAKLDIALEA
jgi:hypothetical protein